MRIRAILIAGALLFTATPSTSAWNEPDGFRGVPWGGSEELIKEKHSGLICLDSTDKVAGDRICSSTFTIGGISVRGYFGLRNGGLVRVMLRFDPKKFSTIDGIFAERYGSPTESKEEEMKTRGGLSFTNFIREWVGERVLISLKRYEGKITEAGATIQLKSDFEEAMKRIEERRKKGAGDL